jgi:hypothetical protein
MFCGFWEKSKFLGLSGLDYHWMAQLTYRNPNPTTFSLIQIILREFWHHDKPFPSCQIWLLKPGPIRLTYSLFVLRFSVLTWCHCWFLSHIRPFIVWISLLNSFPRFLRPKGLDANLPRKMRSQLYRFLWFSFDFYLFCEIDVRSRSWEWPTKVAKFVIFLVTLEAGPLSEPGYTRFSCFPAFFISCEIDLRPIVRMMRTDRPSVKQMSSIEYFYPFDCPRWIGDFRQIKINPKDKASFRIVSTEKGSSILPKFIWTSRIFPDLFQEFFHLITVQQILARGYFHWQIRLPEK